MKNTNNCRNLYLPDCDAALLQATLDEWFAAFPDGGVFALVSEASSGEMVPFLQAFFSQLDKTVVGGIFPQVIYDHQFLNSGAVLMLCREMPDYRLIEQVSQQREQVDSLVDQLVQLTSHGGLPRNGRDSLLLLFDALIPNIGSILESLYYRVTDDVNYIGANVGSESFSPIPCLFDNQRFIHDGLLAMSLPCHPGAVLEHNYHVPDKIIMATATSGNRIKSIDWRPAFEVYVELVKSQYDVDINHENFYQYGVHFPFGIMRMDGEAVVRIPVGLEEDGSLVCVGEIPENAVLSLMEAVKPGSDDTVNAICNEIQHEEDDLILSFYCAGRRMHLDGMASKEFLALSQQLQPAMTTGALSLGEIGSARQGGYPIYHNATIVCSPWI